MQEQNAHVIWKNVCQDYLEKEVPTLTYTTWLKPITPILYNDDTFILSVPNEISHDFVVQYKDMIGTALKLATQKTFDVKVEINAKENLQNLKQNILTKEDEEASYISNDVLNPAYTFESFVVGSGNRFAHAACVAVASLQNSKNYNPLFLYGGSGLGKTHLMHAIGNYVQQNFSDKNVIYVNSENFINEFIEAIRLKEFEPFRNKYRMTDLLLIDDVQFLENKERMQEEFFHTFNALYEAGKNIVMTCDKPPQSLITLEERLKTRFSSGITIDINPPDYETRIAILLQLAQTHHVDWPDEVFDYIATHISSNIRELEGAFKTIYAYSMLGGGINLASTRNALKDQIDPRSIKSLSSELIMNVTANYFNVTVDDLKSKKRSQEIVQPRQISMYLCRNLLNMTYKDIGDDFGNKNHATVMHACDRIKEELDNNLELENSIKEINLRLSPI
ncbi:MAG TPA: chromosomal replication initiator protein DnaA [Clostridiaceae bacterium]|nr:chromosomal replication initiator protein DnaA [Clostridiaceae bacterium]